MDENKTMNEEKKETLSPEETGLQRVAAAVQRARHSAWGEVIETVVVAVVLALILRAFVIQAFYIPSESMVPTLLKNDHILVNKFIYHFIREPRTGDIIVFQYPIDPETPGGDETGRYKHIAFSLWWDAQENGFVSYAPRDFIKRVVGTPGDTVRVEGFRVYVNGVELADDYILAPMNTKDYALHIAGEALEFRGGVAYIDGRPVTEGVRVEIFDEFNGFVERELPGGFIQNMSPSNFERLADGFGVHEIVIPEGNYLMMGDNRNNSSDGREWGFVPKEYIHGEALVLYYPFDRIGLVE